MHRFIAMLVVVALMMCAAIGIAESKPGGGMKYFCSHDKVGSAKTGNCPVCKAEMTKADTYICPKCDMTSAKTGKCPCGAPFVKTASLASKQCKGCKFFYAKSMKNCPVCAKKMKKGSSG